MSSSDSSSDRPDSSGPDHYPQERRLPPARVRTRRSPAAPPGEEPRPELEPATVPLDADSDDDQCDPEEASQSDGSYQVGYAKPPKHTRFQPGRSGNPRGRPKGSRSLATLVSEALDKSVTAKMGRRTVTMKRREGHCQRKCTGL